MGQECEHGLTGGSGWGGLTRLHATWLLAPAHPQALPAKEPLHAHSSGCWKDLAPCLLWEGGLQFLAGTRLEAARNFSPPGSFDSEQVRRAWERGWARGRSPSFVTSSWKWHPHTFALSYSREVDHGAKPRSAGGSLCDPCGHSWHSKGASSIHAPPLAFLKWTERGACFFCDVWLG